MRLSHALGLGLTLAALVLGCAGETSHSNQSEEVAGLLAAVERGGGARRRARASLIALGSEATQALARYSSSPRVIVRWEVANVLGYTRDPAALEVLLRAATGDPEASVRWRALWALRQLDHPSTPGHLLDLLNDDDPLIRFRAAVGGSLFHVSQALPLLQRGVDSPDEAAAWEAVDGLSRLPDPSSVAPLSRALARPEPRIRREAVLSLGQIEDPSARDVLLAVLDDRDRLLRLRAAAGLSRYAEDGVREALRGRLAMESDAMVRSRLERSLTELQQ